MALSKYDIDDELVAKPGTSHAMMVELVGANKRVLDVGCDTGYLGRALISIGDTVSGVEIDPVSAEEAARYLDRVVVADLERVDLVAEFDRESFDVVVFGDVLEHLRDPVQVLRQARPLLARGGYVVISTPNIAHGDVRLALLSGRFDYTKVGILDDTHLRFFTRDSLVALLHDAGFVLAELRRSVAPMFTTELGVREEDFDPSLVESLRADVEATTYQFVMSAVPDDATSLQAAQALRVDALRLELDETHRKADELTSERDALAQAVQTATEQRAADLARLEAERDSALGQSQDALGQSQDALAQLQDALAQLHDAHLLQRSRLVRLALIVRRAVR
jgi:O-antigen biosynthesis protein